MDVTPSLEYEGERQISLLRYSNTCITLRSISAPHIPTGILLAAVAAVAGATDLAGTLPDGSVGVLSLSRRESANDDFGERQFIERLRAQLRQVPGGRGCGRFWIRSAQRWAAELSVISDLVDSLFDISAVGITVSKFDHGVVPLRPITRRRRESWPMALKVAMAQPAPITKYH